MLNAQGIDATLRHVEATSRRLVIMGADDDTAVEIRPSLYGTFVVESISREGWVSQHCGHAEAALITGEQIDQGGRPEIRD